MTQRFVVIGLDHRHVYELVGGLLEAGLDCAGYWTETSDPRVLAGFRARFPGLRRVEERATLMEDDAAGIVVIVAVPSERAGLAAEAMRHGKDVLLDKPGVTSMDDLALLEHVVAETGRIVSVCFSERLLSASTMEALRLVRAGAIGRVVQTAGFGPHRLNRALRPGWFFDRAQYGGILCDIGSHQIDQFLSFAGAKEARIVWSTVGAYADARTDDVPGFENFGEAALRGGGASGYFRVDWFTPDGLATWGDGRLMVVGMEGMIEVRKHIDVEGRAGADHLFITDNAGSRHVGCAGGAVGYFVDFARDCRERTETAMAQRHVFTVCRLALAAQAGAERVALAGGMPA